jgi:biopolymer transport protein ExbD
MKSPQYVPHYSPSISLEYIPLCSILIVACVFAAGMFHSIAGGMVLSLPQKDTVTCDTPQPPVRLDVSCNDTWTMDGVTLRKADEDRFLKKTADEKRGVFIKADRNTSLHALGNVLARCQRAGITRIHIATEE